MPNSEAVVRPKKSVGFRSAPRILRLSGDLVFLNVESRALTPMSNRKIEIYRRMMTEA